ncbi:MAG: SufE family protein [Chromatiaceae bacterium]|nr:SufE family protein [Chromatiaceae bacterium]
MHQDLQAILDDFELLGDWEQRYQYLIELGERLPPFDEADRSETNHVIECMSTVHVAVHRDPEQPTRLRYSGDCDTAVIKGVVALLVNLLSGRTPAEIEALDIDALFGALQLDEHLSPNRHVGVFAIVNRMKRQAAAFAD